MSARTVTWAMRASLFSHPSAPTQALTLEVEAQRRGDVISLEYRLAGAVETLRWPAPAKRDRTDGLWKTTCFEAFAAHTSGYAEFNLSPSGAWASYGFEGYRQGMAPMIMEPPMIVERRAPGLATLAVDIPLPVHADRLGLSAVIETLDGDISYWALAHPSDKPDFHHPASFILDLK